MRVKGTTYRIYGAAMVSSLTMSILGLTVAWRAFTFHGAAVVIARFWGGVAVLFSAALAWAVLWGQKIIALEHGIEIRSSFRRSRVSWRDIERFSAARKLMFLTQKEVVEVKTRTHDLTTSVYAMPSPAGRRAIESVVLRLNNKLKEHTNRVDLGRGPAAPDLS